MKRISFFSIIILSVLIFSCKKDTFITGGNAVLSISADTLHFDTVFTSTGSFTEVFKIRNDNDQKLRISKIALGGGSSSFFKINADGFPGPEVNDIELEANDSTYVFVTVSIDPTSATLPFVIRDSIEITHNGVMQIVRLEAYGKNAHFMRDLQVTTDTVWTNDLPYVLIGPAFINENASLTIQKGSRIYMHADAPLVVDGTLKVEGEKDTIDRVYFKGDRLDEPYNNYPASWPGIYFRSNSKDNVLDYAVIQNAYQGVVAIDPSTNANPKLTLNQCIIDNIYDAGIWGVRSNIKATNCLISNAGGELSTNVNLIAGGNYDFTHCTIVSFGNNFIEHKNPVFYLSNYIVNNNVKVASDLTASFRNCIFWGENGVPEDEVVVAKDGSTIFNVTFNHCLWKVKNDPSNVTASNIINNQSPLFDSVNNVSRFYNFRLKANSPAIDQGINTGTPFDLDGNARVVGLLPDLGAFERQN